MIKKLILIILFLINNYTFASPQNNYSFDKIDEREQNQIQQIINSFKQKNIDLIVKYISYPLEREVPIPSIKNEDEMKKRFTQVFDTEIIQLIANSKISDWKKVGWRGIMLAHGLVWVDDGKIRTINKDSLAEQQLKNKLITQQKQNLHSTLKIFKEPKIQFKTKKFQVRIDELPNNQYRYASWYVNQAQSSKPDLVLNNGFITMEGSGGNHYFTFKSGPYQYIVYRIILGTSTSPDVILTVIKNGKEILKQEGQLSEY